MKLLDLFSGAGGATRGYQLAGFYVVGVDNKAQPHYIGDEFHQADALEYLAEHGHEFDVIHASPPCQGYSVAKALTTREYPRLIKPLREKLINLGKPFIIENVYGAAREMNNPTLLCGGMFGLRTYRHRLFETSFDLPFILHAPHGLQVDKSSGKDRQRDMVQVWGKAQYKGYLKRASSAMGIDWMREEELAQAIPPAYTEWIGKQLISVLGFAPG